MGDFERALKLHLEVQEKRRISLPKDSPQHYQSAANIAKCLWRLNRLNQAQSLVESLIAQASATDGKAPRMERLLYKGIGEICCLLLRLRPSRQKSCRRT